MTQSSPSPPKTMRAVRVHHFGPPEVMQLETVPVPTPGPGEVLIQVRAAGVNYADVGQRAATMGPPPSAGQGGPPPGAPSSAPPGGGPHAVSLPYTPGFEAVGTVAALGEGVRGFEVGSRVAAVLKEGGYAEYAVAPQEKTYPVPDALSDAEATLMLVQGLTAYGVLHDAARIQPGEWVLVEAAAGGVGSLALQLARAAGGRVAAAVGGEAKLERVRALGADLALDYSQSGWERALLERTGGRGADVLLESVGGAVAQASLSAMAPFGRVVLFGGASGQMLPPGAMMMGMMMQGLTFTGFNPWQRPSLAAGHAARVAQAIVEGQVKPQLQTFPLEQAAGAHRALEGRRVLGKAVLEVP